MRALLVAIVLFAASCGAGAAVESTAVMAGAQETRAAPSPTADIPGPPPESPMLGVWSLHIADFCGGDTLTISAADYDGDGWKLSGWWSCHDATKSWSGFLTGYQEEATDWVTIAFDRTAGVAAFAAPTDGTCAGLITRPNGTEVALELTKN